MKLLDIVLERARHGDPDFAAGLAFVVATLRRKPHVDLLQLPTAEGASPIVVPTESSLQSHRDPERMPPPRGPSSVVVEAVTRDFVLSRLAGLLSGQRFEPAAGPHLTSWLPRDLEMFGVWERDVGVFLPPHRWASREEIPRRKVTKGELTGVGPEHRANRAEILAQFEFLIDKVHGEGMSRGAAQAFLATCWIGLKASSIKAYLGDARQE